MAIFLALSFAVHAIPLVPVEYDALFEVFNGTACPTTVCPVWARSADCLNVLGITCVNGHVTKLQIGGQGLTGTLSSALSLLTGLTALYLAVNRLHGSIDAVFALTQLTSLGLNHNNRLNGALSSRLGALSLLTELLLQENNFSQTIPTEIGQLRRLTYLGLSNNSFVGTLPTEMLQLTRLVHLYADGNQFSGVAPVPQSVFTCFLQNNCLQCGGSCVCGQRSSPCAAPPQTLTLPLQITTNATVSTSAFPLSASVSSFSASSTSSSTSSPASSIDLVSPPASSHVAAIAGGVVGGALLLIGIIVFLVIWKRKSTTVAKPGAQASARSWSKNVYDSVPSQREYESGVMAINDDSKSQYASGRLD
jgi:hypothetical protein